MKISSRGRGAVEGYRCSKKLLKKLKALAEMCADGDEASCQAYNEVVSNLRPPFFIFRGVDRYGARRNLEQGRIVSGEVRADVAYFTLDFSYAVGYAGPDGIVYAVKVTDSLLKRVKPVRYSAKCTVVTPRSEGWEPHYLAKEMAFIAEEIPLKPRYVTILYPVMPTMPPRPASEQLEELVEEFRRRGFRVIPFYYG